MRRIANLELSRDELASIGWIIACWGRIEHEIFLQTVSTYADGEMLPNSLNNMQFTETLATWKQRVLDPMEGPHKEVLERQREKIAHYHAYRPAIVHAMWNWEPTNPDVIRSTRVAKKRIESISFTGEHLTEMALDLAEVLYWLMHPGGEEDRIKQLEAAGGYVSRDFLRAVARKAGSRRG